MKEAVTTCHTDDDDIIGVTLSFSAGKLWKYLMTT